MTFQPGHAAVVGAGVVGLTTAITLAEAGHRVTVYTADPVEATTSAAAGALWGPWQVEPRTRVLEWADFTLHALTQHAGIADSGVRLAAGIDASRQLHPPPDWTALLPDHRTAKPAELPAGYEYGSYYTAPLVDMPVHLRYLVDRFRRTGGQLVTESITDLDSLASAARVVVNCSGLGARELAADSSVYPIRGQHVIVTNPGLTQFAEVSTGDSPDLIAIYPHGRHVVLGGTAHPYQDDRTPDPTVTDAILRRCIAVEPRLRDAEVTDVRVGLRPTRPEIRLDRDPASGIIHNYGHGGAGVSLAWGCAQTVLELTALDSH